MAKQNQIIALVNGKKSRAASALAKAASMLTNKGLIEGMARSYTPKDDDGEKLPSEQKLVQFTVEKILGGIEDLLTDLWDCVGTQERTNCNAQASIVVDGSVIVKDVPVTMLMYLDKQLVELQGVIEKLPVLDPSFKWEWNSSTSCYATNPRQTTKTKKTKKSFEASPATDKHPAQVQVFDEDVIIGYWQQTDFCGAIPMEEKENILKRLGKLQEAVKKAREEANMTEAKDLDVGKAIFGYLLP